MEELIIKEKIENKIFQIRGMRVMIDKDLAVLYGVETYQLTRQVRRHIDRFPKDFMFRLTKEENLSCQIGRSSYGGRRHLPYVFTQEQLLHRPGVVCDKERGYVWERFVMSLTET